MEGAMDAPLAQYRLELSRLISRHRSYPPAARRLGLEGRVELSFSVLPDGTITRTAVASPSGHPQLDAAALELIARLERVPAPPGNRVAALVVRVPVDYRLR
jgi:TonB family protein